MSYCCERCGYKTCRISSLKDHLRKKKICDDILNSGKSSKEILNNKIEKILDNNIEQILDKEKDKQIIKELREEIIQLKNLLVANKPLNNIEVNGDNNNINNITIVLNNFGSENTKSPNKYNL